MATRDRLTAQTVTDELVRCIHEETVGVTTYYVGFIERMFSASMIGITGSFGAWSAVSGGGTRFRVDSGTGVPTNSNIATGSPPDLVVDFTSGRVWSTVAQTVYFTYEAYGSYQPREIWECILSRLMPTSTTADWYLRPINETTRVRKYAIAIPESGTLAGDTLSMTMRNAAGGGGSAHGEAITLAAATRTKVWTTLASPFVLLPGDVFALRGDGKNAEDVRIFLEVDPSTP